MLFTLQCGCMGPTMSFRHGAQRAWVIGCIDPAGLVWVQFHLICLGIWDFDPEIIQNCSLSIRKSMVWGTQTSWNTHMAMISRGWIPSYGGKNPGYAHDHPDTPSCFISSTGKEVGCGSQEDGPSTGRNIGPEKNGWKTHHLWIILQPRNHVFFSPSMLVCPKVMLTEWQNLQVHWYVDWKQLTLFKAFSKAIREEDPDSFLWNKDDRPKMWYLYGYRLIFCNWYLA